MRRAAIALLCWFGLMAPAAALAQESGQQDVVADEVHSTRILSLGDAVGGGLGAGLLRMGEADGRYEVTIRFNEESGLARPEVYDWAERLPKILEANSFDAIVVMLGANDRQPIKYDEQRFAFNSPEWIEVYKAQIDRLLDELIDSGARVFWVGLPPMADPDYDAAMQAINAIQRERAERRGVTFLDIRQSFLTPDGRYTDTGPDETGQTRRLRGTDGVSFFKAGNNRMGQLVLAAIAASLARRKLRRPRLLRQRPRGTRHNSGRVSFRCSGRTCCSAKS